MGRLFSFRRVKRREPIKMKVLVEDLPRGAWLDRLSKGQFIAVIVAGCLMATGAVFGATDPRAGQQFKQTARAATKIATDWYDGLQPDPKRAEGIRRKTEAAHVARARSAGCHPNYGGCVPIVSDVDCAGGNGNGPAFIGRVNVLGADVYQLDGDEDGIGCE